MKKNDKIIIGIGIIVLLISSTLIYLWVPPSIGGESLSEEDIFSISGVFVDDLPSAIEVSSDNPFYALIATPLAVHYDKDGKQEVVPLYVKNLTNPSRAVVRTEEMIGEPINLIIGDSYKSTKEVSLELAEKFWKKSSGVLLIEDSQEGYNLGVLASPLASYFSIPIIVTNSIDEKVRLILRELGVKYSMICGDLGGFGKSFKFEDPDDVVNLSIKVVEGKFGKIDYISLTNPIDIRRPVVLNKTVVTIGPVNLSSKASTQLIQLLKGGTTTEIGHFTIPKDYKYALVKFEGINLNSEDVEELGDAVFFFVGPNLSDATPGQRQYELVYGNTGSGGIPIRDAWGHIVVDRYYTESVLYDRGGVEYNVRVIPQWLAKKRGEILVNVIIEKLSDPLYPLVRNLSSITPYLTAYHKGIIFGKPDFAFVANDNVTTIYGEKCPGIYVPSKNPKLLEPYDRHVFKIHEEFNELLAKIADIPKDDLKSLREYYKNNPIYIALVGGSVTIPQGIYKSILAPEDDSGPASIYMSGVGTPSDVIYGNIDPIPNDWSNTANDLYSKYPFQENIVGRIIGWNVEDVSALITRTIFYDKIINKLGSWKDRAVILGGDGSDFQKPFLRYIIFGDILGIVKHGEPMKIKTGFSKFTDERVQKKALEPLGFITKRLFGEEAGYEGFSEEAIDKLKKSNFLNKLLLSKNQLKRVAGENIVRGGELQEQSNFIFGRCHGWHGLFSFSDSNLKKCGLGYFLLPFVWKNIVEIFGSGPGSSLTNHLGFNTRKVEHMDLGPSFFWLDSCVCGKIDGMYPKNSISLAYIHAGVNALIASTTESNIAGGYLEPKKGVYDFPGQPLARYLRAEVNAKKGIYPEPHFGPKMYNDLCEELRERDVTIGEAFRNARNRYLPEDAEWELWWAPPLIGTGNLFQDYKTMEKFREMFGNSKGPMIENKYITYQEFTLYGDPAFNPYEPINGK